MFFFLINRYNPTDLIILNTDCAWNHTYLKGRPIEGGRVDDVPSWYECKQLCAFNPECESFTWNYWPYVCYLMSTIPDEAHTGLSEGRVLHLDVEEWSEELLRQLSYAIKNQLGHPKTPFFYGIRDRWLPCTGQGLWVP